MMNKLLIPQRFKKYPLNLRVKLRFFNSTVKLISYSSYPHLPHGFRTVIEIARHIRDEAAQKLDTAFDEKAGSKNIQSTENTEETTQACCSSTPSGQSCC